MKLSAIILLLTSLLLSAAGGYFFCDARHEQKKAKRVGEALTKSITYQHAIDDQSGAHEEKSAQQLVKQQVITKEVIRYVHITPSADRCLLPGTWRVRHDAAASGGFTESPGVADASAASVDDAAALETVTENYAACRTAFEQVAGWQAFWVAVKPLCQESP